MSGLQEYKCPSCGGAIEFNSQVQRMKCPYCGSEFDVDAVKTDEQEKESLKPDTIEWQESHSEYWSDNEKANMKVYSCKSCGGQIITDDTTAATSCPYCGNPVVMTGQFEGALRPEYVIPFKFDSQQAKNQFRKFVQDRKYVPRTFKSERHIDEIKGVYVPFWVFDADIRADIKYRATRIRSWSDRNYNYTETKFYAVQRGGRISFRKVPVDGSSKLADDLMESIEPFDFSEAVDFNTAYLAGYLADKYDVDENTSQYRANERVRTSTENTFASTVVGFSSVVPEASSIQSTGGKVTYVLYPVWLLSKTYKDKVYTFAMNGQTGKFIGDLPVDNKALTRFFIISSIVTSIVAFGAYWLSMNF